jgi:uncharacterized protein DUF3467
MPSEAAQIYANYLEVGQNATEFVFAFGVYNEGDAAPRIQVRIHSAPAPAHAFMLVLQEALANHREMFGPDQGD